MSEQNKENKKTEVIPAGCRKCNICKKVKELESDYYKYATDKDGNAVYYYRCKKCISEKRAEKYGIKRESFDLIYKTFADDVLKDYMKRRTKYDICKKHNLSYHYLTKILKRLNADGRISQAIEAASEAASENK
ncbi:MAG: hypothetical protein ACP5N7_05260 [Candidatus Pacearchaeota archaeon]